MRKFLTFLACLLALCILGGCTLTEAPPDTTAAPDSSESQLLTTAPTDSDEDLFTFTRENFPVMDGSTSLVPLGEAVASVLLGESREEVADLVNFNRTTQSYRNLMYGYAELLIASEPNSVVFEEMEELGFEIEMSPIATDALIFVVNESNPVDSLTTEQIRGIYAGEITNWKEVGGNDAPILPFQRNADAGSQSLMKKLVMGDTPFMEAPTDYVVGSMMGLMEAVRNYDNSANAIGYSVYYYANDMRMAEGLKILKVNDVEPNGETIRSGAYAHTNAYYCAISADTPEDSPIRILYNWLLSPEGQYLVEREGYVAVLPPAEE